MKQIKQSQLVITFFKIVIISSLPIFTILLFYPNTRQIITNVLGNYLWLGIGLGVIGILVLLVIIDYIEVNIIKLRLEKWQQEEQRKTLISQLQAAYDKRLKSKMQEELNFDIPLHLYTSNGTEEKYYTGQKEGVDSMLRLFYSYDNKFKQLLIAGETGKDRSLLLLHFAKHLLDKAATDDTHPIPIILNLSSWRADMDSFDKWLLENLPYAVGKSGISKTFAQQLVDKQMILPLLNGFGKIHKVARQTCLQKLKAYIQDVESKQKHTAPQLLMCSQISEVEQIETTVPIKATIEIHTLTPKTINTTLNNRRDVEAINYLQKQIHKNPILPTCLTSTFHMHTALNLAKRELNGEQTTHQLADINDKKQIEVSYINAELDNLGEKTKWKREKIQHYLSWLANYLNQTKESVTFELIDLQMDALKKTRYNRRFVKLVKGLLRGGILGLFLGLFFGLVLGGLGILMLGQSGGFSLGLLLGGGLGLASGLVLGLEPEIKAKELSAWNWKRLTMDNILYILFQSLLIGTGIGLICLFLGLFFYVIPSFLLGLIIGLSRGVSKTGFEVVPIVQLKQPYQRLKKPFFISIFKKIVFFIIVFNILLLFDMEPAKKMGLLKMSIGILFFAFFVTVVFSDLFKHLVLRFLLYWEGSAPLTYVSFLNQVAKHSGLLEKDGGQWRFQNQLLQDRLGEMDNRMDINS